jgi:hypothetical protein
VSRNRHTLCPAVGVKTEGRGTGTLTVPPEETTGFEVAIERLLGVAGAGIERQAQLTQALQTRIVVEQAKGVLSERLAIDVDAAWELLRRAARNDRIKIHDLAAQVVGSRATPASIASVLDENTPRRGRQAV